MCPPLGPSTCTHTHLPIKIIVQRTLTFVKVRGEDKMLIIMGLLCLNNNLNQVVFILLCRESTVLL